MKQQDPFRLPDDNTLQMLRDAAGLYDDAGRLASKAKEAFHTLRKTASSTRNKALKNLAEILRDSSNQQDIINANQQDIESGKKTGLSSSMLDRLELNTNRIHSMARTLDEIALFPDPIGEIIEGRTLASGVQMIKKRVPLGVIFTVFESRPNVTVDIGALCIKSGNVALLRGGKEAMHSNMILFKLFRKALESANIPPDAIQLVENSYRAYMLALLKCNDLIDLVVPRGGSALIKFVSDHSSIPVVKHDMGVCTLYIDQHADPNTAVEVAINAKLQRPSVCNTIENLLVHKNYPYAKELFLKLRDAGAILLGCDESCNIDSQIQMIREPDIEYGAEYLDTRLSVKMVTGVDEAISFIYKYSSGHSEGIISEEYSVIEEFTSSLDSAALFVNCSTRFHDGGEMGMGAEVGISTGRLHVRGPMGLKDLTTTSYILKGNGEIRV